MGASTERKNRQTARQAGDDKKALAQQQAAKKKRASTIKWTLVGILVVVFVAAVLILNSSIIYKNTTALSVGDEKLSPAEVNYQYASEYYYWAQQYGSYASMFGLDTSYGLAGLDQQTCPMMESGTWKDYFMDTVKTQASQTAALKAYAAENGIALTDEEKSAIDASFEGMDEAAKQQGFANANKLLAANYGDGVTVDILRQANYDYALCNKAVAAYADTLNYTDSELAEHYNSFDGSKDYYDLAYYLVAAETVEDAEGNKAATDETKAAAKATADDIMAAYKKAEDGDAAAKLDAALAECGIDAASTHNSNMSASAMSSAYSDWMKGARHEGDITVAENTGTGGYYVVVYIGHNDNHYPLAQVRHILIKAVADENGEYTDEAKAEAKAKAEDVLAQWKAGEATEESFAALVQEYSEDAGSNTNGGLYDSVQKGQMVKEFDEFCFDSHKAGDTAIVYGESGSYAGYHVMYYVGQGELASNSIARDDLISAARNSWLEEITAAYPAQEHFWFRLVG